MIDEKTAHLKLPLPHPDNLLEDDVKRLRQALNTVDATLVDALGKATWAGVSGKPAVFPPAAHQHGADDISSAAGVAAPRFGGTAAPGTSKKYAREDHVHPLPTYVQRSALEDGAYSDSVAVTGADGNRVGTIRISNHDGSNAILLGVHDEKNNPPTGLTITNMDGKMTSVLVGALSVGELSGELGNVEEKHQALGSVSGNVTVDLTKGNCVSATIAGATTLTFSGAGAGKCRTVLLELTNGGSAAVTWGMSPHWSNGAAPALTASGVDCVALWNRGAGWSGVLVASDVK